MKRLISLVLTALLFLQVMTLSACGIFDTAVDKGANDATGKPADSDEKPAATPDTPPQSNENKTEVFELSREKLEAALSEAISKIDYMMTTFAPDEFPSHNSVDNVYYAVKNVAGWNQGFYTGILWHAYELTGDDKYKDAALAHIATYNTRIDEKLGTDTHDMGFLYSPSCVAAYKLTGDEAAKEAALKAANNLVSRYHKNGQFIQAWGALGASDNYRLIVDCLMNIPLLYWATEVTGDKTYRSVAIKHYYTTVTYAFREDGSTYHTYFFDPETGDPLRGETHQGASDDSTWARGQAWAMYGPILTYAYEKDPKALKTFCNTANYFLEYLPCDYVPYWDLSFSDGAYEPKDSSAAAIAVCALLEGAKHLDERDPLRAKFVDAAKRIMNSLIDHYTSKNISEANGLLIHATYNMNSNMGVDEMNIWGDYFYMEALNRMLNEGWDLYW